MKTKRSAGQEAVRDAAEQLLKTTCDRQGGAVLCCSAGEEELLVLRRFAALAAERGVSLERLRVFAACEFDGPAPACKASMRSRLLDALEGSGFRAECLFAPSADACAAYDEQIREAGGLDLALLGLGRGCRVAFNEPATPYDSGCHVQKLTDRTREELAPSFGGADRVPERGVTLGFRNLCAAREIVVIALGEEKAEPVFQMLYGRDDSVYPGAFLQLPPNVTLYADEAAAAKL